MTVSRMGVVVIGGGPAGIAAALAASNDGASVLLVESGNRLGGKLKQSIHDGFGFIRYDEALTGPEYAYRDIVKLNDTKAVVMLQTTVTNISRYENIFQLTLSSRHGVSMVEAGSIVLTTGCRERTPFELGIFGMRTSGIFSAGTAQYYLNVLGQLPVRKCLVLGSSNLALVTTRSLTYAGAKVLGVYEPGRDPKGYLDNVSRCLFDFDIPIHLQHTVTRTFGLNRLQAVELARTDPAGNAVRGSEVGVQCDGLIISDDFLPDNDLALSLNIPLCPRTHGPLCDQNRMTMLEGVFAGGNALHISDLADYISESGEIAGRNAARYFPRERTLIEIKAGIEFLTFVPQYIDFDVLGSETVLNFTSSAERTNANVRIYIDSEEVFSQKFDSLRPYETARMEVNFSDVLRPESIISVRIE